MEPPGARGRSLESLRAGIQSKVKVSGSTCVTRLWTTITGKQHVPFHVHFATRILVVEFQDIQQCWNYFPLPTPGNVFSSSCSLSIVAWCSKQVANEGKRVSWLSASRTSEGRQPQGESSAASSAGIIWFPPVTFEWNPPLRHLWKKSDATVQLRM